MVWATFAVLAAALVAFVAFDTGVAAAGAAAIVFAAGVLDVATVGAGVATALAFATATVPAIPKNEAMLSPPRSQRVAAAG